MVVDLIGGLSLLSLKTWRCNTTSELLHIIKSTYLHPSTDRSFRGFLCRRYSARISKHSTLLCIHALKLAGFISHVPWENQAHCSQQESRIIKHIGAYMQHNSVLHEWIHHVTGRPICYSRKGIHDPSRFFKVGLRFAYVWMWANYTWLKYGECEDFDPQDRCMQLR